MATAALFLSAFGAWSEVIIYKGTLKESVTGESNASRTTWKLFLIVDRDTGHFARIRYATINGANTHRTLLRTNTHIVQVTGLNSQVYSAITRIPTDCDSQESPGNETVAFKGPNVSLKISANSIVSFPKILTDMGVGLSHSTTSGAPILSEGTFLLTFSKTETLASNNSGETLDAAFGRLVTYVQSLGF